MAAPVNTGWQAIHLPENNTSGPPARTILANLNADPENIAALLLEMRNLNNYAGLSDLLDELEKNPGGPIFEALKVLSKKIVDAEPAQAFSKKIVDTEAALALSKQIGSLLPIDSLRRLQPTIVNVENITHILAKAIQEQKLSAITAICSSIPFSENLECYSCGHERHFSSTLMEACLELVTDDAEKIKIAKQILEIFCETAEKTRAQPLEKNYTPDNLFGSSNHEHFDPIVIDLFLQLAATSMKSAHKAAARDYDLRKV